MGKQRLYKEFSHPSFVDLAIRRIRQIGSRIPGPAPVRLMEVCGTHTHVLGKSGIRELLSDVVEYRSGPGCPICVIDQADMDMVIGFSSRKNVVLAVFGDMLRVPGSLGSLLEQRARGSKIRLVYSPLDAVAIAMQENVEVVFVGVGFETTAPGTALSIIKAKSLGLKNYSVISLHKLMPPALKALFTGYKHELTGLILPGHVSVITGRTAFKFLASDYVCSGVISGFEPMDVLHATYLLLEMCVNEEFKVVNGYSRAVSEQGNKTALSVMYEVFEPEAGWWRGIGFVDASTLRINKRYSDFDARLRFGLTRNVISADSAGACRCDDVLRGKINPRDCPSFGVGCTPNHPKGVCMVSCEGACSSYFQG